MPVPWRPESRVAIRNLTWSTYETILRERGDDGPRMAFDRGVLEVRSHSSGSETLKRVIARLVEAFCEERGLDARDTGSTTFKSRLEERGLEPDESYYIQNEARVRGKEIDLAMDPPPDLAIEVDLRRSFVDKLGVYAALGIPEVWSHDGTRVVVHLLTASGTYESSARSRALPEMPISELGRFLDRIGTESNTEIVRSFRRLIQELSAKR